MPVMLLGQIYKDDFGKQLFGPSSPCKMALHQITKNQFQCNDAAD